MPTSSVTNFVLPDRKFESNTQAYHEGERNEFHTLTLTVPLEFDCTFYFHDKAQMITALNDLRLTCENKIWELSGMPEYEHSDEPF